MQDTLKPEVEALIKRVMTYAKPIYNGEEKSYAITNPQGVTQERKKDCRTYEHKLKDTKNAKPS